MRIEELINLIRNKKVKGLTCNSKNVVKGGIFIALKGDKYDGNLFVGEAISKGARIIVYSSGGLKVKFPGVCLVKVKDARLAAACLASEFYGNPSKKLKVVAVTGTNGKTTVTYLIEAILKEAGKNCAVIGTVNYRFNNKIMPSLNTTPGPLELQFIMAELVKNKVPFLVMEVSSHALDQERIANINFHSAIFTNLTQDHLDYHKTMRKYFLAKLKLFKRLTPESYAVVNHDDSRYCSIKKATAGKVLSYGIDPGSAVKACDIEYSLKGTSLKIVFNNKKSLSINSPLIGRHNVYNILSACVWAYNAGIGFKTICRAVNKFAVVPGRLERVNSGKGFFIFVDYAHTEDALYNVIRSLRELTSGKIITVFGCGGDRDRTKRAKMGKVATMLSDFSIITNDNPRSENPYKIIADIKKGISNKSYAVIPDRMAAIKKALSYAGKGDIVLIAGKGHENYQIIKGRKTHFDDREAVRLCLRSLS